jgi:hypothetical protein
LAAAAAGTVRSLRIRTSTPAEKKMFAGLKLLFADSGVFSFHLFFFFLTVSH